MSEDLVIDRNLQKDERYAQLYPQIEALMKGESDELAKRANLCAALKEAFGFLWVGFYRVVGDELVLGNFQGPVACTRIKMGRGVCGQAWERKEVIIVDDVEEFPGHIACSSASKSEIVLPVFDKHDHVIGVLDIDHDEIGTFDKIDQMNLEKLLALIT
jgi:GAF domain-containing protein